LRPLSLRGEAPGWREMRSVAFRRAAAIQGQRFLKADVEG